MEHRILDRADVLFLAVLVCFVLGAGVTTFAALGAIAAVGIAFFAASLASAAAWYFTIRGGESP